MKCFHLSCPKVFTVSNFFLGIVQKWLFTSIHSFGLSPPLTRLCTETVLVGAGGSGSGYLKNHKLCRRGLQRCICELQLSLWGFPGGASGKESTCQCRRWKRCMFSPWIRKIPWRGKWHPTSVFLPGRFRGQRSLVDYSPRGCKESDTTKHIHTHTHTQKKKKNPENSLYMTKEKSELGCCSLSNSKVFCNDV